MRRAVAVGDRLVEAGRAVAAALVLARRRQEPPAHEGARGAVLEVAPVVAARAIVAQRVLRLGGVRVSARRRVPSVVHGLPARRPLVELDAVDLLAQVDVVLAEPQRDPAALAVMVVVANRLRAERGALGPLHGAVVAASQG